MFQRAKNFKRDRVAYLNILTPLKDYHNVKVVGDHIAELQKGINDLLKNENNERFRLAFPYNGKSVMIMPDTLLNSIIEINVYEQHWWGLKKIK